MAYQAREKEKHSERQRYLDSHPSICATQLYKFDKIMECQQIIFYGLSAKELMLLNCGVGEDA